MLIPTEAVERDFFFEDLIRKCTASQHDRSQDYALLRHYFLHGRSPEQAETPYNKIFSHIDTLTAFLFASETTKFSIHIQEGENEIEYPRLNPLNRAMNNMWLSTNADQVFSQALTWSLVYNSMFIKLRVDGSSVTPFTVDPASFGVLREDMSFTDRQEAMVHSFYTTYSQLERDLAKHPQKDAILASVVSSPTSTQEVDGLSRLIMTATAPNVTGNVNSVMDLQLAYTPMVDEERIRMHELWVWDDEINDYRVVTRLDTGTTIYDRKNFFLKGENPFIQICANPMYSYYWGMSEVGGMTGLQKWRNERVEQIRKLLNLQANPPTSMTGWQGIMDEKQYAVFSEGSFLSTDSMQAKIERHEPKLPADLFNEIREIDAAFAERSGLQNILMGKGETGVRSGSQTSTLAKLSSARIKKRALVVEDALEAMATLYLKIMQKYDPTIYQDADKNEFVADQFTSSFVVKVDAHSNSPLFVEDANALASEMLQLKIITRERFVEIISPPDKELIIRELKVIEAKEKEAQEAAQKAEQQKKG